MLNKLSAALRELVQPGDTLVCAVSGGADSVALLFGMYLLREKLQLRLSAAHFNHHLREGESDEDEAFVREFCARYEIPLTVGGAFVQPGKKGLEAAAREARYAFLRSLPGKIATAHTADDNAETLLMHLLRGTGLKGLGGIAPVNGPLIRPMLNITRQEVVYAMDAISGPVSLYDPVYTDGGESICVMDQVGDSKHTDEQWLEQIALSSAISNLNDRDKRILSLRFYAGKTQMEVASEIGISQAQVSRLEKNAISKIKKNIFVS